MNNSIKLISKFYPGLTWHKKGSEKVIYLTFDDGPIPGVTEFVLETLDKYAAKATFFCVGDNVVKNKEVFLKIVAKGHVVANHTFNHLKGWNTSTEEYIENVRMCQYAIDQVLQEHQIEPVGNSKLFRPPYGKSSRRQLNLLKQSYEIIMWSVLTGDFDAGQSPEQCLHTSIRHSFPGAIVIFHDSIKAEKNLRFALPRFLEHFSTMGFRFSSL